MNEHVDDLLALYALGGLEPDELRAVTDHLAICATCRAEADRQTALVAAVAGSVPARAPDPRLRAQVLARAGVSPQPTNAASTRPAPAPPAPRARAGAARVRQPIAWGRWLAGAAALLMAGLIGWNMFLTNQVLTLQRRVTYNQNALSLIAGANTAHMPLVGQGSFGTAGGNAYIDQTTKDIVIVVQQLQPLPDDQTYQAWLIDSKGPTNAGLFRVSDRGWGMAWLSLPYEQGSTIGVSLEPKDGSPQPTHVVLLSAQEHS
jgi:anti-sigma-K factor RskA